MNAFELLTELIEDPQDNGSYRLNITGAELSKFWDEVEAATSAQLAYNELLYAVASKYPGETRHQTALRYIKERENKEISQQLFADSSPLTAASGPHIPKL